MALEDKIEAVKKIDKVLKNDPSGQEIERIPPNKEHFDTLMSTEQRQGTVQPPKVTEIAAVEKTHSSSIFDQVKNLDKKVNTISQLSPEDLRNQVRDMIAQMETVKSDLGATKGNIGASYQHLMHNRLTHIDDNIKVALSKAGVEYKDVMPVANLNNTQMNPLDRFLGLVTHGQYQLEHLSSTIGELGKNGQPISPVDMMRMQIKVGIIQQEIELFTGLLNKALESTKTLMNVQV
jgi:regulator of replication initiation timing